MVVKSSSKKTKKANEEKNTLRFRRSKKVCALIPTYHTYKSIGRLGKESTVTLRVLDDEDDEMKIILNRSGTRLLKLEFETEFGAKLVSGQFVRPRKLNC
jgi:hypothetical protein